MARNPLAAFRPRARHPRERRRTPRVNAPPGTAARVDEAAAHGILREASPDGFSLELDARLKANDACLVVITFADGDEVTVEGRVVHCDLDISNQARPYILGFVMVHSEAHHDGEQHLLDRLAESMSFEVIESA